MVEMKNKNLLIPGLLIMSVFLGGVMNISYVNAYVGTYEKRTNLSNPFVFIPDILYYDGNFGVSGIEEMFHQVFLFEEIFYIIYISSAILYSGDFDMMKIHLGTDNSTDYLYTGFEQNYNSKNIYLFKPSETGFYNITLRLGKDGFDSWSSMQIGVLELPSVNLNDGISWHQWDFSSDHITAVRINLDYGTYEIGAMTEDNIPSNFPGAEIYYMNLANYWIFGSHLFELIEDNPYLNGTKRINLTSGEYLFYSLSADWFGIRKAPEQSTGGSIPGYSLYLIVIVSLISIILVSKKVLL